MENPVLILKVLGEGGIIQLIRNDSHYFYSTDESAFQDLITGESIIEELSHNSPDFTSFDEAIINLQNRYPLFSLYPQFIHPDFIHRVSEYFVRYLEDLHDENNYSSDSWKRKLNYNSEDLEIL